MNETELKNYNRIRSGGTGAYKMSRGLIAVWGKEAAPFLDGMITNDVKTLGDGQQMLAAFPNAQGRLLEVVRVLRQGDRFLFETEEATREKLFNNLFRFTFAGDFFVKDLSEQFRYFELIGEYDDLSQVILGLSTEEPVVFEGQSSGIFVPAASVDAFRNSLDELETVRIDDELYETLRIESGIPKYGVDMDENTIVPELGLENMISYTKGCYVGQEIIARIHFRGHVAKRLAGVLSEPGAVATGSLRGGELTTADGKNAGKITSVTYSPKLERTVALAFVRYDHLAQGTELMAGGSAVTVTSLPFIA
jgi:folate-binding protein YgfZ